MAADGLKAPFPWFGGKSRVARIVWQRFGDVGNYIEPFAGSLAVLLGRPHWPFDQGTAHYETVNDLDCHLTNAWRAIQADPAAVAKHADWPTHEADLLARHKWINSEGTERVQRLRDDPNFFDPKVAGWWIWGLCVWIGPDWYSADGKTARTKNMKPSMTEKGVNKRKMPFMWNLGINRKTQQGADPDVGRDTCAGRRAMISGYMSLLSDRLRNIRVCCGDWVRVLTPACTIHVSSISGVFLDPPYCGKDRVDLYAHEDYGVAHDAYKWAVEHGGDRRFRIALCGYEGEYATFPPGWRKFKWKALGGFGNQRKGEDKNENRLRERVWFSPYCLQGEQALLFGADENLDEMEEESLPAQGEEEVSTVVPARGEAESSPDLLEGLS